MRLAEAARLVRHAYWERLAARTRHGLCVVAGLSRDLAGGRPRLELRVGCLCGWQVDEQSASPQDDAHGHLVRGTDLQPLIVVSAEATA